jgi:hypothetical protein
MTWVPSARRLALSGIIGFSFLNLPGCSNGPFDGSRVRYLIESKPVTLDGEQVQLTDSMVQCGQKAELWELEPLSGGRSIGRLLPAGMKLKFSDDVQIGEMRNPYAQVRGDFSLTLLELQDIRDEGPTTKIVDARVGVRIDHSCFQTPPLLMGVRHGRFTQDYQPRFQFTLVNDDYQYDSIVH